MSKKKKRKDRKKKESSMKYATSGKNPNEIPPRKGEKNNPQNLNRNSIRKTK